MWPFRSRDNFPYKLGPAGKEMGFRTSEDAYEWLKHHNERDAKLMSYIWSDPIFTPVATSRIKHSYRFEGGMGWVEITGRIPPMHCLDIGIPEPHVMCGADIGVEP